MTESHLLSFQAGSDRCYRTLGILIFSKRRRILISSYKIELVVPTKPVQLLGSLATLGQAVGRAPITFGREIW
ncbi:hypothetical protein AG1IA_05842 [Rhizoctonia solani AG-1 IA]|uniref:Uncharacterized protein n=1 Tax=Thanatephorus cucumeris (strain AG1-IA) TaxID=983506 RepID=L8WUW2_THACA|nr:hypothetical protein AG1IA_05842 [Rhizoctonia solani AG-1 IA]